MELYELHILHADTGFEGQRVPIAGVVFGVRRIGEYLPRSPGGHDDGLGLKHMHRVVIGVDGDDTGNLVTCSNELGDKVFLVKLDRRLALLFSGRLDFPELSENGFMQGFSGLVANRMSPSLGMTTKRFQANGDLVVFFVKIQVVADHKLSHIIEHLGSFLDEDVGSVGVNQVVTTFNRVLQVDLKRIRGPALCGDATLSLARVGELERDLRQDGDRDVCLRKSSGGAQSSTAGADDDDIDLMNSWCSLEAFHIRHRGRFPQARFCRCAVRMDASDSMAGVDFCREKRPWPEQCEQVEWHRYRAELFRRAALKSSLR